MLAISCLRTRDLQVLSVRCALLVWCLFQLFRCISHTPVMSFRLTVRAGYHQFLMRPKYHASCHSTSSKQRSLCDLTEVSCKLSHAVLALVCKETCQDDASPVPWHEEPQNLFWIPVIGNAQVFLCWQLVRALLKCASSTGCCKDPTAVTGTHLSTKTLCAG